MTQHGPGSGKGDVAAVETAVRAWFDNDGWKLEPAVLRAYLEEHGADEETIVELIDEGADRRRQHPQPRQERSQGRVQRTGTANGNGRLGQPSEQVPPQNLEAEESVLGAAMLSAAAVKTCRDILHEDGREFYRDSHARIWRAALRLADTGGEIHAITLTHELEKTGELEDVGGRVRLHELAALVPATANVGHYARIVAETAQLRSLIRAGGEIARLGWERGDDTNLLLEKARELLDSATAPQLHIEVHEHLLPAGDFIFDTATETAAVWGNDTQIGWASGEACMLVGPQGVGKTTIAQQLVLARAGLRSAVLGMPVQVGEQRILYVAADRPKQAARSIARMVGTTERGDLNERVAIWRGPLPWLLNEQPGALARFCERHHFTTVVLDSVKDVAVRISEDEPAAKFNMAVQHCLTAGVEVLALHHQRKEQQGGGKPKQLADVYGNTWLTAGFGSVILLWGDPGDPIVELRHLKQPVDELGPWHVRHDHERGHTSLDKPVTIDDLLRRAGAHGITARTAAGMVRQTETPTANEIEKARRQLLKLTENGVCVEYPGSHPADPTRYVLRGAS